MSRLRRGTFGLAALFAIALQVFVVQTHVHALGIAHAAPEIAQDSNEARAHAQDGAAGETQRSCVVCQALADAGRMLPAGAAQIVRADDVAIPAAAPDIPFVAVAPSHSWQSRAPPIVL